MTDRIKLRYFHFVPSRQMVCANGRSRFARIAYPHYWGGKIRSRIIRLKSVAHEH